MRQVNAVIRIETRGRGLTEITDRVVAWLDASKLRDQVTRSRSYFASAEAKVAQTVATVKDSGTANEARTEFGKNDAGITFSLAAERKAEARMLPISRIAETANSPSDVAS